MKVLTIIVAEDDPIISWRLKIQLESWGVTDVRIMEDNSWPWEIAAGTKVDFVLTNLKLSDGWIDRNYLIKLGELGSKNILLTGLGDMDLHPIDEDLDFTYSFLPKPFSPGQLRGHLR